MTARTKPPFRADHVGSILRSAAIKEARASHAGGRLSDAGLKEVEDREIEKIIKKQEEIGLKLATDGEYRRSWWHFDFFGMLDGVEIYELDHGIQFQGVQTKPLSIRVKGKIGFGHHPMLDHFRFVKAHTKVTPKMCIPSPSVMHFRLEPGAVAKSAYADRDAIFDDLAKAYQDAIRAFYDAGCRYLQFDDTAWAYLCSEVEMKKARDRGLDVDHLQDTYTRCINKALEAKPADMVITTHVCRGNFRSTFISSGRWGKACSRSATTTATSSSTTATAPAASSRCASCPKAIRSWCSASSPPSSARWKRRTTSSAGSTKRRNSPPSTSSRSPRNAASRRPRKATSSPRTSSGRSCG
jgi:5-methyltetrahydropteroyltriglutamate--homocysteine methyltransferase